MVNQSLPLITVIIAVYNGSKVLQRCIDSIIKQTYINKELIIIDGGSKDGTVDLLEINKEWISYWISEADKGIYNAWNKGLSQAKGDWICFLGADDYFWDARVLECMVESLGVVSLDINLVYGQIMVVNSNRDSLYTIGKPWVKVKNSFRQIMAIPHPGAMHRNAIFQQYGQYNESFRIAGDYELLLRELKTRDAYFIPNLITVAMMQGGVSSNLDNRLLAMREMRRAQRMHGYRFPGWIWLIAVARISMRIVLLRVVGEGLSNKIVGLYRRINSEF